MKQTASSDSFSPAFPVIALDPACGIKSRNSALIGSIDEKVNYCQAIFIDQ